MKKVISVTVLLFVGFQVFCQNKKLLIRNVTVIPLHINQQLENKDVVIDDGKIIVIRNHKKNDTVKYDLGIVNAKGKYLIPSFSDAHAHLPEKENLQRFFLMNLLNGVTTLRSMRGEMWHLKIDKTDEFTPRLILGSPAVSWRDSISDSSAERLILNYKTAGFDFLKVLSVKNQNTFNHLVKYAENNRFSLAGHCPSNVGIVNVCNSNVYSSIEHLGGFFQLKGVEQINNAINLSISKDVYHCPTLDWYFIGQVLEEELRSREGVNYLSENLIEKWETKITTHHNKTSQKERFAEREDSKAKFITRLKYLRHIYHQGAKLLLSPDASGIYGIPGFGIHMEMQHFADADISNFDTLKAACYNLSVMLGSEQKWGTIRVGSKSDLILLEANPIDDIENTKTINGVIFKGRFYLKRFLEEKLKTTK